jgi:ACR3 family arsenite efflux pump ArsB
MSFLTKFQPLFIVFSAFTGIIVGKASPFLEQYAGNFIEIFLMFMLFFIFLNTPLKEITKSFLDLRFSISALAINFIVTPLFAWMLSKIFFDGRVDLQTGFIMLLVTPCTDWYLIFTGLAKGNVTLGASILPLNLILQILLLPVYLLLFMGEKIAFEPTVIIHSILLVLIIPLVSANMTKIIATKINRKNALSKLLKKADDIQFVLLCLAIIAMFSSQGAILPDNALLFIKLLPPLLLFFGAVFCLSFLTGSMVKLAFTDIIPLIFTTSARNSPVSLAIAVITFPSQPALLLTLAMGPLVELPILAIISALLKIIGRKKQAAGSNSLSQVKP